MTSGSERDRETRDLEQLVAELKSRVEQRRLAGGYADDLETTLDQHFDRLLGSRARAAPMLRDELEGVLRELEHLDLSRAYINPASDIPGGQFVHRLMVRVLSREIDGILAQVRQQTTLVASALSLLDELMGTIGREYDTRVLQQLDDLQVRSAESHREVNRLELDVSEVRERIPGCAVEAWYPEERFAAAFRGSRDDLRASYADLASVLLGCDPVVDLGFGRGEFMELLGELGVKVHGVESDPQLVASARGRGLDAERGFAIDYLRDVEPGSLGGIVLIQVIEHLSPQHVIDFVALAAEKLRRGGKVVLETVNPASLYTYAHAFWLDPDHVRPVHPSYLEFLFREAQFAQVEIEYRSPVTDSERLLALEGDDPQTRALNENFARINGLLFGAQDYAIIATR